VSISEGEDRYDLPALAGDAAGAAENPFWAENGAVTVEDPDRWRVVLMPQPPA
jgi:YycE-like C-terminal domain